jgi:hypothetical protein
MKLLTKEIESMFKKVGYQDGVEDPVVVAKFFTPWSNWTWFATEYDPESRLFFGMVHGHEEELGYFSLDELASVKGPFGLGIERDTSFDPRRYNALSLLSEVAA